MTAPILVTTVRELRAVLSTQDAAAQDVDVQGGADAPRSTASRAVVMTMGALHEGHLTLVRRARELARHVVVTIFVNPLQFGPGEDLDRYPRTLDADVELLAGEGVDVVFAPSVVEMYPEGTPRVSVTTGRLGTVLEGAARPGHFDGVATVVLKLLNLTRPDVAVFGEKDAQQLLVVERMVHDLDVDVQVVGVPIKRDDDGLALSSRNAYLDPAARARALVLSRALRAGVGAADRGPAAVLAASRAVLAHADDIEVDYLVLVDPTTVESVGPGHSGPARLLVAARVAGVRLIDNTAVTIPRTDGPPRTEGQL